MEIDKVFSNDVDGVADNLFSAVKNSVSEIKAMQQRKAAENVQLVIQALKKIESDLQDKFDGVTTVIDKRVAAIKDGRDGLDGRNGRDGKDGRPGRDGAPGARGAMGVPGTNGRDGEDGVSVTDARIDFDGSLVISLSSGREINVGEVVAPDLAEKIKVITNGGGTSQSVLDTLASLQAQITAISSLGAVNYRGTWDASTNTPTIAGGSGTKGYYYVVSVAGSTNIDGQTLWGVGDWIIYNGTAWQRVDGGSTGNFTTVSASGNITTGGDIFTNPDFGIFFNGPSSFSTGIFSSSDGSQMRFYAGNTVDALRLTGTGLGVFNNSPAATLDVTGTARISSTVTLSGGTANGVAYLNGSKVLTTGSALTYDGTNFYLTSGDAILSNIRYYDNKTSTGAVVRMLGINSGDIAYVGPIDSGPNSTILSASSTSLNTQFYAAGSEQMRLTSSGLEVKQSQLIGYSSYAGIGTNGLAVAGSVGIGTSSPGSKLHIDGNFIRIEQSGANTAYFGNAGDLISGAPAGAAIRFNNTALRIASGSTQIAMFDSSGNLGIGVTPSAWSASYKAIEQVGGSLYSLNANSLDLVQNAYNAAGGLTYKTTAASTLYRQSGGLHYWFTAPSGTAGTAATYTQAMTLDASGNLLLGTTSSDGSRLRVYGSYQTLGDGAYEGLIGKASSLVSGGGSGDFAIRSAANLVFATNGNTERARITSAGVFIVGDTAVVASSFSGVKFNGGLYNGLGLNDSSATSAAGYVFFQSNGTTIGSITRVAATSAVAYNTTSDQRLKENIEDAAPASDLIDAIQVRQYNWKSDGSHQRYGFIAQELVDIAPEAVHQPTDSDEMMGVDYSKLVPMLVKELQSLRRRVAQLEGNQP